MSNNTSSSQCSSNCINLNVWYCRRKCNDVSNNNSNKISTQRPLTLLLMTMTIMLLTQMPQSSSAAVLREENSSSLTSSVEESASAWAAEEDLLPQHFPDLQLDSGVRKRIRLRKRENNKYFQNDLDVNSTTLEWENPCNGVYDPTEEPLKRQAPMCIYLNQLRESVQNNLSLNETLKEIDISEAYMWRMHSARYKFLPKLKQNSDIVLKRWYRNMQNYVAAFAYLGRTQYKYDKVKHNQIKETTKELNVLFLSAQELLCEIETTINSSYPQKKSAMLTSVSRAQMNKRLNFLTRIYEMHEKNDPNVVDLLLTKHHYFEYLDQMVNILSRIGSNEECQLQHNSKRANKLKIHLLLDSGSASSSESASVSTMAKDSIEHIGKDGKHRKNQSNRSGSSGNSNKSGRNSSAQGGNRRKKHRHVQKQSA
ncbi:uncharacterized protein LOC119667035 [Teleopsis dalmanni]|uniref:uncharacterized protein LOC119667035 n=1 Tax=Teleopsis dalmanni TaxID=139649 RepID=UPI0018CCF786|nr:uncharacterized protein LOC119667035 [Teleopsis dalmanni]